MLVFLKDVVALPSVCSEGERVVPQALPSVVPDIYLVPGAR